MRPQPHQRYKTRPGPSLTDQSRRVFLQRLLALGATAAGAQILAACSSPNRASNSARRAAADGSLLERAEEASDPGPSSDGLLTAGHVPGRILVIIDLAGGNDGLSTVVPAGSSTYYDLRPNLALSDDVIELNDQIGLHPRLSRLHKRGLTVVEGVGPTNGDLSHFEMASRWRHGDMAGTAGFVTGFGGRLTDALHDGVARVPSPAAGVSLAGTTPFLLGQDAPGMAMYGPGDFWFLEPTDWKELEAFQQSLRTFGPGPISEAYEQLLDLGELLGSVEDTEVDWEDPMLEEGGDLGSQLRLAADLIQAGLGTQVIYTQHGDFDTHSGHQWRHDNLMAELDVAVDGFLNRMDQMGMGDQVVVATISEFGRRVEENDGGLDHGSASAMLVAGALEPQVSGSPPDLDALDEDGNLVTTIAFDRYLAALAEEWLGVRADAVLPDAPSPLDLF